MLLSTANTLLTITGVIVVLLVCLGAVHMPDQQDLS